MTIRRALGALLAASGLALMVTGTTAGASGTDGYKPIQQTNIARQVPAGSTLLPSGRLVSPVGTVYDQGDFPLGLAVSPDGTIAVATGVGQGDATPQGSFEDKCIDGQHAGSCGYGSIGQGTPPAATPDEALFVTNLSTGKVTAIRGPQTQCKPGNPTETLSCFELGVAFSPDGTRLYATGGGNDAVYVFPVTPSSTTGDQVGTTPTVTYLQLLSGAAPASKGTYQSPNSGTYAARTKGLAVSADGAYLFVTEEQAGVLDILKTSDLSLVQQVTLPAQTANGQGGGGTYPYQVVVNPTLTAAYVSLQGVGAVATVPLTVAPTGLTAGTPVLTAVGKAPTGLALSPDATTLIVANANDDTASVLHVGTGGVPTPAGGQTLTVKGLAGEPNGSSPDAVAFASNSRAYVALAGDNAVAQLDLGSGGWAVSGAIPTGWYPTSVAVRQGDGQVLALAAKGLGERFPAIGGYSRGPVAGGPAALDPGYYDASAMPGLLSSFAQPDAATLASDTTTVSSDISYADQGAKPAGSPIPSGPGQATPITHVVYIVRENRTWDQEYGDLATTRNDADSVPAFQSLAAATPNGHAIVNRYASSDSFYSDGEASVQGHWWTSSANTDDYVEKSWRQYYSDRSHPSDEIAVPTVSPANCSLFQDAVAKQASNSGFTWKDYGEPVGAADPQFFASIGIPNTPGAPSVGSPCAAVPAANIDPQSFSSFLGRDDRQFVDSTFKDDTGLSDPAAFLQDNGLNPDGTQVTGSTASLRNLSYLELPGDHTTGFTAQGSGNIDGHTPRAEIAENDAAVGEVVSALSHSKYWSSTAVFMVEDDSQDGPDHVDGHRNVLLVASPWAKQTSANGCYSGYISHVHTDQAAVVRTVENILGLAPLSSYDANATPLYDLFQNTYNPSATDGNQGLTAADLAPFTAPAPAPFVNEKVGDPSAGTAAFQAALETESSHLDMSAPDKAGPVLEDVIWKSASAKPVPAELAARVTAWNAARSGSGAAPAVITDDEAGAAGTAFLTAATPTQVDCTPTDPAGTPGTPLPEARTPVLFAGAGAALVVGGLWLVGRRPRRRRQA